MDISGNLNLKAIALGCLADLVGTAMFGLAFGTIAVGVGTARGMSADLSIESLQLWAATPAGSLFSTLSGLGFTCLGGYVSALTSRQESLINSALVGGIAVLAGLPFLANIPATAAIASSALAVPAAILGGFFHARKLTF